MPDRDQTPSAGRAGRGQQDDHTDNTDAAAGDPQSGDDDAAATQPQPNRGMSVGQTKIGPLNDPND